jgi:hypothetical protein
VLITVASLPLTILSDLVRRGGALPGSVAPGPRPRGGPPFEAGPPCWLFSGPLPEVEPAANPNPPPRPHPPPPFP